MVQSVNNIMRPEYTSVNIRITKPEVNTINKNQTENVNDNGIYNSVKIDIDNPSINSEPKKVYDYPENENPVTYDMIAAEANAPKYIPVAAYYESSVIVPDDETTEEPAQNEAIDDVVTEEDFEEEAEIPAANFTTVEAEKGEEKIADTNNIQFKGNPETEEKKMPEIVPPVEIKPDVDISKIVSNLESEDFDVQAKQIEEIARTSLQDSEKASSYIVKDVYTKLIDIINKDNSKLQPPSEQQIQARKKIISNLNFIATEFSKGQKDVKNLPFQLTEEEKVLANTLSPLEQAERNKEYAIYTISILDKVYIDEIQKETNNVVPITDVPGISDVVNALRDSQNPGIKIAAIEALVHIRRPEYKQELETIFSVAQNDKNPIVAENAAMAIQIINK